MVDISTDAIRCTKTQQDGAEVVRITLDRSEKLNALTPGAVAALIDVVESFDEDDGDSVVVAGEGDNFCTGADVSEFDPGGDGGFEIGLMQRLVDALRHCPLPVVSRIQGRAFGAGFMIGMASDVVVATESAQFGLQEVNLGMPVEGYVTTLLPRIVGERRAREWILTGSVVPVDRAMEAGFVTSVVPASALDDEVASFVSELAEGSGTAIAALKTRMADPVRTGGLEAARQAERKDLERAYESGEVEARIAELLDS